MDPRVSVITLAVGDLAAARRFYVDELGWPVVEEVAGEVIFVRVGETSILSLWNRAGFEAEVGAAGPASASPIVLAHNVPTAADVDAVVARVIAAGGALVAAPQRREWGGYTAYIADPEGYRWEIAHNPTPMGESLLP